MSEVLHRDLKPDNILVDPAGQPKILDFGIARAIDDDARKRLTLTHDGQPLGTPAYMSPEQARGEIVDHRSDVYSLGVITFELLTGALPHEIEGLGLTTALQRVAHDSPRTLRSIRRQLSPELDLVISMCLSREPEWRYSSARDFGDDLHRLLTNDPIRARAPSRVYTLRKFVQRNAVATAFASAFAAALIGGIVFSLYFAIVAIQHAEESTLLADRARLARSIAEAHEIWPSLTPTEEVEAWLDDVRGLLERIEEHRGRRDELRSRALPWSEAERKEKERKVSARLTVLRERLRVTKGRLGIHRQVMSKVRRSRHREEQSILLAIERLRGEIARFEGEKPERSTWTFARSIDGQDHDAQSRQVAALERLLSDDPSESALARVVHHGQLVEQNDWESQWSDALPKIRENLHYRGLAIDPAPGLFPLAENRQGYWEFWHLPSGERPRRPRGSDHWLIDDDTGMVFILLPGGTVRIGAEKEDDSEAGSEEAPAHLVSLDPFLISRYEMTQGQWIRLTGENPSRYSPDWPGFAANRVLLANPVETVSWNDCDLHLRRWGLHFPTEAQWEYAARGGTSTPYWCGREPESIESERAGNLADWWTHQYEEIDWPYFERWLEDQEVIHAPVGSFRPNPFGLHDTIGNVREWCRDWNMLYTVPARKGDGMREMERENHVVRGGAFSDGATFARSSKRLHDDPNERLNKIGIRPIYRPLPLKQTGPSER